MYSKTLVGNLDSIWRVDMREVYLVTTVVSATEISVFTPGLIYEGFRQVSISMC